MNVRVITNSELANWLSKPVAEGLSGTASRELAPEVRACVPGVRPILNRNQLPA
jgi:hypothetical protein